MSSTNVSTGLLSASAQVFLGRSALSNVVAHGDGTNVATIEVFDGTDDTGVLLAKVVCPAGSTVAYTGGAMHLPVRAVTGIYVKITGTGAGAVLHWGGNG